MAWNKPTMSGEAVSRPLQKQSGDRFPVRGAIAGAVVVLGAAVAAWWLWPSGESAGETPPPQPRQRIKEVKPVLPASVRVVTNDLVVKAEETNAVEEIVIKPGAIYAIDPREKAKMMKDQRISKTGIETQLEAIFTTEVGDCPPMALPLLSERDLARLPEILISKNEIQEDDSEDVREVKQVVDYAKAEYRKFIKNGGDPRDFLPYYREELQLAYDKRREAQRSIAMFLKEAGNDDPDLVREYVEKVDKSLTDAGIKPTEHSKKLKLLLNEPIEEQNVENQKKGEN